MDRIALGIDIGGTNLRGALITERGDMAEHMSILSQADKGIDALIDNLASLVARITKGRSIAGVGIGIPGIIDSVKGIITQAPNISHVNDYPLRDILNDRLGGEISVSLENDANCAALGEWWMGAGKDVGSLIMITLGTGVGGGIILDGELWSGADGMAGEVGHITVFPNGAKCNCGNFGCLESYASASAVRRMVKEGLNDKELDTVLRKKVKGVSKEIIPEIVRDAAAAGDGLARGIWDKVGEALGIGMAGLVNLLNVEMVVIGGGLSNAWELFIHRATAEAKRRGLKAPMERVEIRRTVLGDHAGILGAGYLVYKNIARSGLDGGNQTMLSREI